MARKGCCQKTRVEEGSEQKCKFRGAVAFGIKGKYSRNTPLVCEHILTSNLLFLLQEENIINLESNASGKETMAIPTYNFDHHSDDEDVDMSEKPPLPTSQITRTYRRKKSVD